MTSSVFGQPFVQELSSCCGGRPFGHKDMGRKGCCAALHGGAGSPSNAVWPGLRSTSIPSGILIHPTVWPQYTNVTYRQTEQRTVPWHRANRFTNSHPKTVRPVLSDRCLFCLSLCNVGVLWPNSWMNQDATWYGGRPRPRRHCVR